MAGILVPLLFLVLCIPWLSQRAEKHKAKIDEITTGIKALADESESSKGKDLMDILQVIMYTSFLGIQFKKNDWYCNATAPGPNKY